MGKPFRHRPVEKYVPRWNGNDKLPVDGGQFYVESFKLTFKEMGEFTKAIKDATDRQAQGVVFAKLMRGPFPAFEVERPNGDVAAIDNPEALWRYAIDCPLGTELATAFWAAQRFEESEKKTTPETPSEQPSGGPTTPVAPAPIAPAPSTESGASSIPTPPQAPAGG